jgi:hypothetical protein
MIAVRLTTTPIAARIIQDLIDGKWTIERIIQDPIERKWTIERIIRDQIDRKWTTARIILGPIARTRSVGLITAALNARKRTTARIVLDLDRALRLRSTPCRTIRRRRAQRRLRTRLPIMQPRNMKLMKVRALSHPTNQQRSDV